MEMKAEERLAQCFKAQQPTPLETKKGWISVTNNKGVFIAAEQIDLIADLVVERLRASNKVDKE